MLKDYKELLRMMGVINSDDTVGFTSKQVEVQLDTLKRKMQTIKDDLQSMVMDVGANGGLTSLKSMADHIDNIVVGLGKMNSTWGETIKKILEVTIAVKGVEKLAVAFKTTSAAMSLVNSQVV